MIIEYTVKREIKTIPITDEICAYKEKIIMTNRNPVYKQGISLKDIVENIVLNEQIPQCKYKLYSDEVKEFSRCNLFGRSYNEMMKYHIKKPYDYIEANGLNDVELLNISFSDYNIYDISGKKLPKAILFNYSEGFINNEKYNLDKFLNLLKKRNDIIFLKDGIIDIPYYNADEKCNKCLEFIWCPSNEDFEKIAELSSYQMRMAVCENIFGIKQRWEELPQGRKLKLKRK